jgi:hypothetical protein
MRSRESGLVHLYTNRGHGVAVRREVTVYEDQSAAANFVPMRLRLPYGLWTCPDGSEVLFNRDYCAMWAKSGGKVFSLEPDTWIDFKKTEYIFEEGISPWDSNEVERKCLRILKNWGVENQRSLLSEKLSGAIATGDIDSISRKNRQKLFPAVMAAA